MVQTSKAITLLDGRYQTSNDVTAYLNLALDIAKMNEADDFDTLLDIYKNGAPRDNPNSITLQSLSLTAEGDMKNNPFYHMFRYAFWELGYNNESEEDNFFDGSPVEVYADTIVQDLFSLDITQIESDAALVMNVWMAAVNGIFEALAQCKVQNTDGGIIALDRAVALWIGAGQEDGSNEKGHMLYNMAENAGELFDQDNGETIINTNIIESFVELQTALLTGGSCRNGNLSGFEAMRKTVHRLTGMMTVPLVQNLIHHINNIVNVEGSNMVELFTLGIIPRVATCNPHAYEIELKLGVLNTLNVGDEEMAIEAIQQTYSCLGLTCEDVGSYMGGVIPACSDNDDDPFKRGRYETTKKGSRIKAYLDRDIKQIDVFLKYEATAAALDWYTYGWNSIITLQELAKNEFIPELPSSESTYFSLFSEYYGSSDFVHEQITNILLGVDNVFDKESASKEQVRNAVTGLLKYTVMFVASVDSLKYATWECFNGNQESAMEFVDSGAMFFIGSMESENMSSKHLYGGEFMFAMAKELCTDFDTCIGDDGDNDGSAKINEVITSSMTRVAENIESTNCEEVASLVDDTILPAMAMPLIQGLLKYASLNENLIVGTDDANLAIGHTISRGILPLINRASPDSAEFIKGQMEYQLTTQPVASGFKSVADTLRGETLSLMSIKCTELGVLVNEPVAGNLCSNDMTSSSSPPKSIPNSNLGQLAFGRYSFVDLNAASIDASFALDVRGMFDAYSSNDAKTIYIDGANALQSKLFGDTVDGTPALASLSTQAAPIMYDDPMFNIYKYALYDDIDFDGSSLEIFSYANDIVIEALNSGNDNKLAAEATVILQIFMVVTHKLYSAVRMCNEGVSPELIIDSAVALWIGENQGEGKFDDGWMIYSVGQSVQKFFGFPEGEAPINSKLMELFIEAQTAAKNCLKMPDATRVLRSISHEIIRSLTQPLIKSLLFHMVKDSRNMVELYAVAVIPQSAACNPKSYSELQSALYSGYNQQTSLTEDVLDHLATFLKCQRITCENIQTGADADASLSDIVKRLCDRLEYDPKISSPLAGYTPQYEVKEEARLDLDALELYIMMRTEAYGAAEDVYKFGHNSVTNDSLTLYSLSTISNEDIIADEIISQALSQKGQYATATRGQLAESVRRTLQSIVFYKAVLTKIQSSITECKNGSSENARREWDRAVSFFVGSIEGILAGGKADGQGELMYALGNEFCGDFSSCETSGEATVNQQLMFQFASGKDSLVDGECDHLIRIVPSMIIPKMLVPLIQGTISSSIKIDESGSASDPELFATAHILARAVTPFIEVIDSNSASVLSQNFASLSSDPGSPSDIVETFGGVLGDLGIVCDDIGNPSGYYLCSKIQSDDVVPTKNTPTNLADNLYVTTTYVKDRADIALDVKDMSEALAEGNNELAQLIYRKGKNSEEFDEKGKFVRTRSLKSLSTESSNDMLDEPEFNMYMYTLGNKVYADQLVEETLENSSIANSDIATEAVMVLNVWMEIVHLMHETLQACKNKQLRDDSGVHSMDAAVAYWIGDGQIAGDSENGHLLYALSENFGEAFNIDNGGQSRTNTNILRLFNKAKNEVSLPNACSESQTTYARLRDIVNQLIPQMAIPLIQGLIKSLRANDRERVKIYAHAFVPLVAGCNPSLFVSLKEKLLANTGFNVVDVELIIGLIRQSYDCLGLKCDDIGVHETEINNEVPECNDPEINAHLAGYRPANDVREYSRLDLDIREMDVLLQMKAYSAAKELYSYGKHARGSDGVSLSIGDFATTKHRSIVPEFDAFVRYYNKDTYADEIIRAALDPVQGSWTDEQRRMVVVKSSQILVMYFAALQNAYEAVSDCISAQKLEFSRPSDSWDKAAAILIGSLEGTQKNGTSEGYMFYDLAQQYCQEFGTCLDDITNVDFNEELVSLLYTGRGATLSNSCRALEKAADEISILLLIPIIQGALSTSTELSNDENLQIRAEGYVYSRGIVPFVRNRDAAKDLDLYLGNPAQSDRKNIATKTYGALAKAYPNMKVDCEKIGTANGVDTCSGVVYVSDYIWVVVGVLGGLLSMCCCGFFIYRFKRKSAKLPENNPRFISSGGELNHSMDLLEKAFSPKGFDTPLSETDEEMEALNNKYNDSAMNNGYEGSPTPPEDDNYLDEVSALTTKRGQMPDII